MEAQLLLDLSAPHQQIPQHFRKPKRERSLAEILEIDHEALIAVLAYSGLADIPQFAITPAQCRAILAGRDVQPTAEQRRIMLAVHLEFGPMEHKPRPENLKAHFDQVYGPLPKLHESRQTCGAAL